MEMILGLVLGVAITTAFDNKEKLVAYVKAKLEKATLKN
jgi:hypothetical protein